MGTIVSIKCKCKDIKTSYSIGFGMRYKEDSPDDVIGYCNKCNKIECVSANSICECGTAYKTIYTEKMLVDNNDVIDCPRCHEQMKITETGLWD